MSGLPKEILEKLRCFECNNYLSIPPINLLEDGKSICGRCIHFYSEQRLSRNKPFELIASSMFFPCQYKNAGCKEEISWENVKYHEIDCDYRQIRCPISPIGKCCWFGSRSALIAHFDEKHPIFIIPHPCNIKTEIANDCESNLLTYAFGFLFLIQVKYVKDVSKIWYGVRYLGKSKFSSVFAFDLTINGGKNSSVTKRSNVSDQENFTIHQKNCVELDLKQLQKFMGDYSKIEFIIEIRIRESKCFNCKMNMTTFPIYLGIEGRFCENCKKENCIEVRETPMYTCKYADCLYFGTADSLPKHELWHCVHNVQPCLLCNVQLRNKIMLEHWQKEHVQNIFCSNTFIQDNLKMKTTYVTEMNVFGAIFFVWWNFEKTYLDIKVVSTLSKDKINDFLVTLKSSLYDKAYDKAIIFKENYTDQSYDWKINTKVNKRSYGNNGYDIEFSIKKKNDDDSKSRGSSMFYL